MTAPGISRRALLLAGAAIAVTVRGEAVGANTVPAPRRVTSALIGRGSPFVVGTDDGAITSLRFDGDRHDTDYVRAGDALGHVHARVRLGAQWHSLDTRSGSALGVGEQGKAERQVAAHGATLGSRLVLDGAMLRWDITVTAGDSAVEVGDLFIPLPMPTQFLAKRPPTEAVMKHSFVSGHGSHVFWMRSNSVGPYLMMLPDRGTALEYWNVQKLDGDTGPATWCAYLHAGAAAADTAARGTNWRQPTASLRLEAGETRRYAFRFQWVADYAAARAAIVAAGLVDVEVAPGMTVPSDLQVDVALASVDPVDRLVAEYPAQTMITRLPDRAGRRLWRVRFERPGENRLTIEQAGGRRTYLEFFATEPVETMMKKRAAFIVRRQHRDATKWYDGLFGEWAMDTGVLLGPDNYDRIKGWRIYEVTCDDPGLSKPAYLATKNAEHPDASEVAALDHYVANFVWGGLQMTTTEGHPYAIYGIPDWKQNRESADRGPKGRLHIWRPYDYPHIFAMYHALYRIARDHPGVPTSLTARDYLSRAAGTAIAMFVVPMAIEKWSACETGFYNECVIPALIDDLRAASMAQQADILEAHWAKKVRRFVAGAVDLFGSEYPFDSTGFESTQALARSAMDRSAAMSVSPAAARAFADRQAAANIFCRGWLEPAYYYLGSDYRANAGDTFTLSYMSQMGGWALLDRALNDIDDPHSLLRLGYASQLSAWALLNSGPAATGYGYWYPGEANDGAAGGGFEPAPEGMTWLDQPHQRGPWYYSCETDLGFCGALRAARTIVADDPVFGRIAFGGQLDGASVEPRDGVRRRLSLRLDGTALDVELINARFAAKRPINLDTENSAIVFQPEFFDPAAQEVALRYRLEKSHWIDRRLPIIGGECRLAYRTARLVP
ncbi:DUF5695 domain-containing protein [Sphingomonas sp. 37zxx]|uniref:DUF5695 domain-containing protein n=1 Tax=Sphingomonas sp. 37zxx TaxID=1550073 RepID=UPI000AF1F8CF|nr:DUF5695 domain-containing protein [Sphingomonas sp. 37zxx]